MSEFLKKIRNVISINGSVTKWRSRRRKTNSDIAARIDRLETRDLLTAGSRVSSFGITDGLHIGGFYDGTNSDITHGDVVIQSDGQLVVAQNGVITRIAANGNVDASFGAGGVAPFFPGVVRSLVLQADGRIIAAGNAGNNLNRFTVARYNTDGTLDHTFGTQGWISSSSGVLAAVTLDDLGRIVLAGHDSNGTNSDFRVTRLNYNGTLDLSFGSQGTVLTNVRGGHDYAYAVACRADGGIVVAGSSRSTAGKDDFAVVQYLTDGTLDSSFSGDGIVTTAIGTLNDVAMAVTTVSGYIVVGGYSQTTTGRDFAFAKYSSGGTLTTNFSSDGKTTVPMGTGNDEVHDLVVQPNGAIVAVGVLEGTIDSFAIARLTSTGTLDTNFSSDGKYTLSLNSTDSSACGAALRSDGHIVVSGHSSGYVGIINLTTTGVLNSSFSGDGVVRILLKSGQNDGYKSILVQQDGIYLWGNGLAPYPEDITGYNVSDVAITRLTTNGLPDTEFSRDGTAYHTGGSNLWGTIGGGVAVDGSLVILGEEFLGSEDNDWTISRLNSSGTVVSYDRCSFGVYRRDDLEDFVLLPDNSIVAVGWTAPTAWGQANYPATQFPFVSVLAKLTPTGEFDTAFSVDGKVSVSTNATARRVAVQQDGKILVASESLTSDIDIILTRYTPDGTLDVSFGTGGVVTTSIGANDDYVTDLIVQPDGRILISGYSTSTTNTDFIVRRLTSTGQPDTTFSGDGLVVEDMGYNDRAYAAALQPDGAIVVAGIQDRPSNDRVALMRLLPNGNLDPSFSADGKYTSVLTSGDNGADAIAITEDGKLLVVSGDIVAMYELNNAPQITTDGGQASVQISLTEGLTTVRDINAADEDSNPLKFEITGGLDAGRFQIDAATGVLTLKSAMDFEQPADSDFNNRYEVIVRVTDGWFSDQQSITVNVTNQNESPTGIVLSSSTISENADSSSIVGTLTTIDPDANGTYSFTLVSGTGDGGNANFQISGNLLKTSTSFDFETQSSYSIRVRTTDQGGVNFEHVFLISVINEIDGTVSQDAFVLTYTVVDVTITLAVNGGVPVNQGTYPLTSPVTISTLQSSDSVRIVGTSASDVFAVTAATLKINGAGLVLEGPAAITVAGKAGADRYELDADALLGTIRLEEEGEDIDTIDFSATSTSAVALNLGIPSTQVVNAHLTLTLNSGNAFENAVGGGNSDTLTGNALANILTGNSGNDRLTGYAGNDSLIGGLGDDTYVFAAASAAEADNVTENLNEGTDTLSFASLTTSTVINLATTAIQSVHTNRTLKLNSAVAFENLVGGSGADSLFGNSLDNTVTGGAGDDKLIGATGNDLLLGGANNDTYVFVPTTVAEADQVTENVNEGIDTLNFAYLTTGVVVNLGSTAIQTVHTNRTLKLNSASVFENIVGGSGSDTLFGNSLDNNLTAGAGDDQLIGAAGNDVMLGGADNDTFVFVPATAAEADTVSENLNQGTDTLSFAYLTTSIQVNLGSTSIQSVHLNRTLKLNSAVVFENIVGGAGADTLFGNTLNNKLSGNAGDDKLLGSSGSDILLGGPNNDTYMFVPTSTTEADQVTENANEGVDTLNFAYLATSVVLNLGSTSIQSVHANRTLKLNSLSVVENAVGGTGSDTLLGNAVANRLTGGPGDNILVGMESGDILEAGSGRDILIGGLGLDILKGDAGDDIMIAGRTTSDTSVSNLNTLRTQWVSANLYPTRITNLRAGVGSPLVSLKARTNVLNDAGEDDVLYGGTGIDWFIRAADDVIADLFSGEILDLL